MRPSGTPTFLFSIGVFYLLVSCNPARNIGNDQYLLLKNDILIKKEKSSVIPGINAINKIEAVGKFNEKINTEIFAKLTDELLPIVKQKPNRRLLGIFPVHLAVYNLFNKGKERKLKSWIKNTIGEKPVIFDSLLTIKTRNQFELYLHSLGYFDASVTSSFELKKSKKAVVHYTVTTETPYTLKEISFAIRDTGLAKYKDRIKKNSLLVPGENYNAGNLANERERIASELKNEGYFFFSKEYVFFDIDTALNSHQVNISVVINRVNENNPDSGITVVDHERYFIDEILVRTDYNPKLVFDSSRVNSVTYQGIKVLYAGLKPRIKPQTLHRVIFLKNGELYRQNNQELTLIHLSDLGIFKFTSVNFSGKENDTANSRLLSWYIRLTPSYRQSYSYEFVGTNTGGNLGIGGNVAYRNKNLFRGAELLEIKFSGGVEAQKTNKLSGTSGDNIPLKVFNTIEAQPEISLVFPKFIVPWKPYVGRFTRPKSLINLSYNYQLRPEYLRKKASLSLSYQWNETKTKKWIVTPVDLSLVDIGNKSQAFIDYLEKANLTIKSPYEPHLIPAMRISFVLNTQEIGKLKNFWYFRINLETAGNLFWATNKFINLVSGDDVTYVLKYKNIDYSQYIRPDTELKYYWLINQHNTMVYRVAGGIGLPYGNTNPRVMPFDKAFFGGGANDMRGWGIRSLGPGSYKSTTNRFEQAGDIKMIGNLEYRFDFVKFLQGALFIDAGNVWMRRDTSRAGAEFETKNWQFVSEIGIDAGIGLRLNFSFFVFRLDYAMQMRTPSEPALDRWVILNTRWNRLVSNDYSRWQVGIGYPF